MPAFQKTAAEESVLKNLANFALFFSATATGFCTANPSEGLNIPDLPPGDHKLKLSYDGDDYYAFNLDLDYTVKESAASDISLSTVVGSHILKVSGVPSDLSEKILVTINGTTYEGTASGIEIPSFSRYNIIIG